MAEVKFKHPDGCCPICGNLDLVILYNEENRGNVLLSCRQCRISFRPLEIFDTVKEWADSALGRKYSDMVHEEINKNIKENLEEKEMVSHPDHYQSGKGLEVIDVIEAFTEDLTGVEAFDTGNIIKYICRWNKKSKPVEDLKKVVWYTQHLINHLENTERTDEKD